MWILSLGSSVVRLRTSNFTFAEEEDDEAEDTTMPSEWEDAEKVDEPELDTARVGDDEL